MYEKPRGVYNQSHYNDELIYKRSLLEKQIVRLFIFSLSIYTIFETVLSMAEDRGYLPMCTQVTDYPHWLKVLNFGSAFAFCSNAVLQLLFSAKYFYQGTTLEKPLFAMHSGVLTVLLIAGSSQFQSYIYSDVVCVDGFGVYSIPEQWSEWIVTVPLLAYLGCAIVSKEDLSRLDWLMLMNIVSMIFTGFMIIVHPQWKWFYFIISMINYALIPAIVTAMDKREKVSVRNISFDGTVNIEDTNKHIVNLQHGWRREIFGRFMVVCTFFPVVYCLQATGLMGRDVGIACFLVGSLLGKLMFSSIFAQSYMHFFSELSTISHSILRSHEARRSFLRYVFHELRIPMNSLAMGIPFLTDLVGSKDKLLPEDLQLIQMIQTSATSLSDNMNHVLTLHRIREGEISDEESVINLQAWLTKEIIRVQEELGVTNKDVVFHVQFDTQLPVLLFGSEEYLRILLHGVMLAVHACVKHPAEVTITVSGQAPKGLLERGIAPHRFPSLAQQTHALHTRATHSNSTNSDQTHTQSSNNNSHNHTPSANGNKSSENSGDYGNNNNMKRPDLFRKCNDLLTMYDNLAADILITTMHYVHGVASMLLGNNESTVGSDDHHQHHKDKTNSNNGSSSSSSNFLQHHANNDIEQFLEQELFICFSSSAFELNAEEMRDALEPSEDYLSTAEQQEKKGAGMGMVLATEILRKLHLGSVTFVEKQEHCETLAPSSNSDSSSSTTTTTTTGDSDKNEAQQGLLISFALPIITNHALLAGSRSNSRASSPSNKQSKYTSDATTVHTSSSNVNSDANISSRSNNSSSASISSIEKQNLDIIPANLETPTKDSTSFSSATNNDNSSSNNNNNNINNNNNDKSLPATPTTGASLNTTTSCPDNGSEQLTSDTGSSSKTALLDDKNTIGQNDTTTTTTTTTTNTTAGNSASVGISSMPMNRKLRILVVDDTPSNSKMLCHALTRRGHVCVVAENGLEAVHAVEASMRLPHHDDDGYEGDTDTNNTSDNIADADENSKNNHIDTDVHTTTTTTTADIGNTASSSTRKTSASASSDTFFDLIFIDNTMPIMTGVEATQILRHALHYPNYIIGITGNVLGDDLARFLHAGVNLVLLKPLRMVDIDSILQHVLDSGLQCDLTQRLRYHTVTHVVETYTYQNSNNNSNNNSNYNSTSSSNHQDGSNVDRENDTADKDKHSGGSRYSGGSGSGSGSDEDKNTSVISSATKCGGDSSKKNSE